MTLPNLPNLPPATDPNFRFQLSRLLADIILQVNAVSSGSISAVVAMDSPPVSGLWGLGDEVRNTAPQELGTAGSKYVLRGWICVVAGEPGVWKEQRILTGN